MVIMVQFNPELAKSAPSEALPSIPARPGSVYSTTERTSPLPSSSRHTSISSRHSVALVGGGGISGFAGTGFTESTLELVTEQIEDDDEVEAGRQFTFIPPNPKKFYKRLLELCIQADLDAMANLPEDQEVSLGILSPKHIDLINECALRWRIGQSYRVACFMDVIKAKYEREEVPLECIPEGLQMIAKAMHDVDIGKWPKQDVRPIFAQILCGTLLISMMLGGLPCRSVRKPLQHIPLFDIPLSRYPSWLETFRNRAISQHSRNIARNRLACTL